MDKTNLKETLQHGTVNFPVAVYNNIFPAQQSLLAHLHYHNEFELLVATRGTLCVQVEECSYIIPQGEGIFINSGRLHTISAQDEGEHGFVAVVFDAGLLCGEREIVYEKYVQPLITGSLWVKEMLPTEVCSLVYSICREHTEGDFGYEIGVKQGLLKALQFLVKEAKTMVPMAENSKSLLVKEVLDYMKKNFGEPISLQLLAEQVHVSREYLCRTFRALSDCSPIDFLNRYRIRQSTFLLVQTDKSILEIAQACGFNHSSYYGKLFLEYMGCTPTEYRKREYIKLEDKEIL